MTDSHEEQVHSTTIDDTLDPDRTPVRIDECIVEIISDSGEGAQTAGQMFGTVSAKMGNGVWTVEIIPAEIEPPARSTAGASGIRIRVGSGEVTNAGDAAQLVVSFNEQVLVGRETAGEFRHGADILLENKWREHKDPRIALSFKDRVDELIASGYRVHEIPMELECKKYVEDPSRGQEHVCSRDAVPYLQS